MPLGLQAKPQRPGQPVRVYSESPAPRIKSINILNPICVDITGDPDERRSFHHFRVWTAYDLSNFFHSNFWQCLVFQIGHSELAVKHALIAVGAAHETYLEKGVLGTKDNALALQQYNKSIAHLRKRLSSPSRRGAEVTLICCVLFICYESLRGDYKSALTHLHCGIHILNNRQDLAETTIGQRDVPYLDPQTDEKELIEHLTRLEVSACTFMEGKIKSEKFSWTNSPDPLPRPFLSLTDARRSAEILLDLSLSLAISQHPQRCRPAVNSDLMLRRELLIKACDKWSFELDALLKSIPMATLPANDLQAVFTLIMHMKATQVIIRSSSQHGPDRFRPFEDEFKSILSIASWLISPTSSNPPDCYFSTLPAPLTSIFTSASTFSSTSPTSCVATHKPITSNIGIIAPLYYVSKNSIDPAIRRAALDLLATPRREGIWESLMIAKIEHSTLDFPAHGVLNPIDMHSVQSSVPGWKELFQGIPVGCVGKGDRLSHMH